MRSCKDHDEKTTANASPSTNEQRSDDKIDNGHAGNRAGSSNKEQGKGARKYAGQRATTRKKTFADRSQIERSIDWAAANNKRQWDNQIDRPPRSKTYRGRRRAFMSVPPRPVPTVDSSSEDGDKSDDGTGESDSDMVILSDPPKARKENDMAYGNNKSESGGAGDGSDSDVVILGDLPKAREGHSANDVDDEANSDMVILSDSPEHRSTGQSTAPLAPREAEDASGSEMEVERSLLVHTSGSDEDGGNNENKKESNEGRTQCEGDSDEEDGSAARPISVSD